MFDRYVKHDLVHREYDASLMPIIVRVRKVAEDDLHEKGT